jgi:TPR repeat protein
LNNLIAGVQFYLLGEKDQARRYVQQNVAFESEVDLSNMLLEAMASGNLQKNELSEMLQKFIQVILPPAEKLAAKGKGREALAHGLELYFQSEYARALEYFKVSAGEEIPLGFYMCCRAYNLGQGNEKDLGASGRYRKRFDQAIEKGTEGYEENAELIQRYAGEGNPDAQFLWGRMHGNGYGVPQSYAEAVKWYRKAAEQGDAEAQYSLGQMYGNGRGVPQDMETAYMWFYVAASKGFRPAQDTVDDLDGKGLFNRKKLSSEEIARAKQRARDFLTKQSIMDPENRTKNQTKKWGRNAGTSHRNSR